MFLILFIFLQIKSIYSQTDRTMKIAITNKRATTMNEFNTRFFIHWSFLELPETTNFFLHEFEKNPQNPCNKLQLFLKKVENDFVPIYLPEKVHNRLLQYLNEGPKVKPFVCLDFVQFLMDVPYSESFFYYLDYSFQDFSTVDDLVPGQFVIVWGNLRTAKKKIPSHFAVYLGHSLFLWKFGPAPGLCVSDLRAMEKAFIGNHTQILVRKNKFQKPISIE